MMVGPLVFAAAQLGESAPEALTAAPALAASIDGLEAPSSESSSATSEPPEALPPASTPVDAKWQPALDYDADGCYSSPAIGPDGETATGLPLKGSSQGSCHDESDLDNTNAYVRTKCQGSWCARKYAFYFEKDQDPPLGGVSSGHSNDLEHVVVWVENDHARFVAVSQHGEYQVKSADQVLWEGSHPKVVYHRDGLSTHAFRFAGPGDDPPENDKGVWQFPALVSWHKFPPGVRDALVCHDFGRATLALKDDTYGDDLARAKPAEVPFDTSMQLRGSACSGNR